MIYAQATSYTGWHHVDRTARVYAEMDASVDVFDACDAALYADEPKLMHKYTRGDGGVVYEYYAREDARSETVCGARCFVRERFTHVNITDVALEGTTESTRREAPGVAEREGPCAALCPGG